MIKIGVTGKFCSGKDTFADYLVNKGFEHISLSDIIREECLRRGLEVSIENLQKIGNELREREGNDFLARRALEKIKPGNKYVITSFRNPIEVKHLASSKNFVMVNVDAPTEKRFDRSISRGRNDKDPKNFKEFKAAEDMELNSKKEHGQKILECIDMAKFTLNNDGNVEDFHKEIENKFPKIYEAASFSRPSWDEYFMEMAQTVGKRGTCDRGRSGSVIVKNKRLMTTGYVGSPSKLAHCDEVGHWFKKTIHEDASVTQHCIRTVHAEANAIAQAAKNGINIEGSTLYCKMEPCLDCTKLLISAGIKRVVAQKGYQAAKESREIMEEAGVKLEVLDKTIERYDTEN